MDPARPANPNNLLNLQQTAQILGVSIDVLLEWNENNILKPTISQNGLVVYTEEQINQFLTIRELTQKNTAVINSQPIQNQYIDEPKEKPANYNENIIHTHISESINLTKYDKDYSKTNYKKHLSFSSASYFVSVLTFIVVVALIAVQNNNPINENQKLTALNQKENNSLDFNKSTAIANNQKPSNNQAQILNQGEIIEKNKIANNNSIFSDNDNKSNSNSDDQLPIIKQLLGIKDEKNIKTTNAENIGLITHSQKTNFDPSESNNKSDSVFDENGNIKGDTMGSDVLASTLGIAGTIGTRSPEINSGNINVLFGLMTIILASFVLMFRKQILPALHLNKHPDKQSQASTANFSVNKLIELDQKTDGTVVLYFQGREYKVCKPELDSESDQFIGRLLELTKYNIKEIEYDSLSDDKLRLNTPLSKIVTRLGFVGIRRDLFFPRTSKNRVLFRKYVTDQDLLSMNITPNQLFVLPQ